MAREPKYTRITKRVAQERWDAGLPVILCPCKLYPGGGFSPGMLVQRNEFEGWVKFDEVLASFAGYNCNSETGRYPSYWVTDDMPSDPFKTVVRRLVRQAKADKI